MLLFSDDHLRAKNLRDCLIPSRDINNRRILQSDWLRSFQAIPEKPYFYQAYRYAKIIRKTDMQLFRVKKDI